MATVNLHTGILTSPKHTPLSDAAMRLWLNGLCWSKEHLTDGFIPDANLPDLHRQARRHVGELLRVAMPGKQPLWQKVGGGYQIHDYVDWQDSADHVQTQRRKWREQKRGAKVVSVADSTPDSTPDARQGVGGGGGADVTADAKSASADARRDPKATRIAVLDVVALWNASVKEAPVDSGTLTPKGQQRIADMLALRSVAQLEALFQRIGRSDYATGRDGQHDALTLWRAFDHVDRIEAGDFDDRKPRPVKGHRPFGVVPAAPSASVKVEDPDYNGARYLFDCAHTPTCARWPQHRDLLNDEAVSA